jgi:hypothetical protein
MRTSWNAGSVRNQLDDCPFCLENWPNLYMMALPIHIGPYGMGRGNAMMAIVLYPY